MKCLLRLVCALDFKFQSESLGFGSDSLAEGTTAFTSPLQVSESFDEDCYCYFFYSARLLYNQGTGRIGLVLMIHFN